MRIVAPLKKESVIEVSVRRLVLTSVFVFLGLVGKAAKEPLSKQKHPVSVILDTDMGSDYDDAGALATLHALADMGEAKIIAIATSNQMQHSAQLVEIFNRYYGRADIPIGAVKGKAADINTWHHGRKWTSELPDTYFHTLPSTPEVPDVIKIFRSVLASQPDQSVVFVTIGFFTNLRNLMDSAPDQFSPLNGRQLIEKKVVKLV